MNAHHTSRRRFQLGLLGAALILPFAAPAQPSAPPVLQVWKDPGCGCCNEWVDHLEKNGFQVQRFDTGNTAVRKRLGLPEKYGSCHTGLIAGYVIEGHVNAQDIQRLLREKPQAIGLAVPGMPIGSPGMDGPVYGERRDAYDVLLVQRDGSARVYQHYPGQARTGFQRTSTEAAQALPPAEGEVRRVDARAGRITIRHGEIRNLDMPPMTMTFQAREPALLETVKAGDKVRFTVEKLGGVYVLRSIEPTP